MPRAPLPNPRMQPTGRKGAELHCGHSPPVARCGTKVCAGGTLIARS